MMNSWWILWMVMMVFLLVSPVSYGWGYRGWGPPYPTYVQRRRSLRAAASGAPATFDHRSWGWGGDFVWVVFVVGVIWVATALCGPLLLSH
jgi:hypothetical protein